MTNDPHPLQNHQHQLAIEKLVSAYRDRPWAIEEFRDLNEFSSHPSAILSDGFYPVFAKLSGAANTQEQFETELAGLRLLAERAGVLIPTPIGMIRFEEEVVMVLEGVRAVERTAEHWRQIGRTLAKIHCVRGRQFGLETHNYFGPLYQDNRPLPDWPTFYAERRLWPRLAGAIHAGQVPTDVIRQVEKLISRLPQLCGPEVPPTLLHGDAQQHNFISTEAGAVVIDPAVHYGNPELDLAYVDFFHPVPEDLFIGYQEEMPIDPGFWERRALWRIYGYLAVLEVGGMAFLPQLTNAVQKYL